jgi:hypothetical protein
LNFRNVEVLILPFCQEHQEAIPSVVFRFKHHEQNGSAQMINQPKLFIAGTIRFNRRWRPMSVMEAGRKNGLNVPVQSRNGRGNPGGQNTLDDFLSASICVHLRF